MKGSRSGDDCERGLLSETQKKKTQKMNLDDFQMADNGKCGNERDQSSKVSTMHYCIELHHNPFFELLQIYWKALRTFLVHETSAADKTLWDGSCCLKCLNEQNFKE